MLATQKVIACECEDARCGFTLGCVQTAPSSLVCARFESGTQAKYLVHF